MCSNAQFFLLIFDLRHKEICIFDSMANTQIHIVNQYLEFVLSLYATNRVACDESQWTIFRPSDYPVQYNDFDCGLYVCNTTRAFLSGKGSLNPNEGYREIIKKDIIKLASSVPELVSKCVGKAHVKTYKMKNRLTNRKVINAVPRDYLTTELYVTKIIRDTYINQSHGGCALAAQCLQKTEDETMLECDGCRLWFHESCTSHKAKDLDDSRALFFCKICKLNQEPDSSSS